MVVQVGAAAGPAPRVVAHHLAVAGEGVAPQRRLVGGAATPDAGALRQEEDYASPVGWAPSARGEMPCSAATSSESTLASA